MTSTSTNSTTKPMPPFTLEVFEAALRSLPPKQPIIKFYASGVIAPNDCVKILPKKLEKDNYINLIIDNSADEVYICGVNVRDALIEKGFEFENYKPEA
jgi:hypothetical protein